MNPVLHLFPRAPAAIEIELTTRLIEGGEAIGIVGLVAGAIAVQAALNDDLASAGLLLAITLVAWLRIAILRRARRRHGSHPSTLATARRWQRNYALGSFATSLLLGASNLYALSYRDAPLALLAVCGLCCYVFSLIARTAARPLVCLPSVAIALVLTLAGLPPLMNDSRELSPPFALAALASIAAVLLLSCVQLAGLLYRTQLADLIGRRDLLRFAPPRSADRAREPACNARAFRSAGAGAESRGGAALSRPGRLQAGERRAWPKVGDVLLRQVAARLTTTIRPGDYAFRIGGDEFIIL